MRWIKSIQVTINPSRGNSSATRYISASFPAATFSAHFSLLQVELKHKNNARFSISSAVDQFIQVAMNHPDARSPTQYINAFFPRAAKFPSQFHYYKSNYNSSQNTNSLFLYGGSTHPSDASSCRASSRPNDKNTTKFSFTYQVPAVFSNTSSPTRCMLRGGSHLSK